MTARLGPALAALAIAAVACGGGESSAPVPAAPGGDAIERVTRDGPVTATATLRPASPRLGDSLVLELRVEAEPGVDVDMPAFGDALGRFSIQQYEPRDESRDDGGTVHVQRYTLQAPMSGHQRIPPLRVTYVDGRAGAGDAGPSGERELLTDELPVQVASVLPEDVAGAPLRGARGRLELPAGPRTWLWALLGGGALALLGVFAIVALRRGRRARIRISAYDTALRRLAALERRGLPEPVAADAWYVELSGIIRRYLEDRYSIRAPELTTEEFLREARRSRELTAEHQRLLSRFLLGCDRVKFAGHAPDDDESRAALLAARQFLDETRVGTEPAPAAVAEPEVASR